MASRARLRDHAGDQPEAALPIRPPRLRRGRGDVLARRNASWLALARELPAVARLVFRLARDPRVSRVDKLLLAGAAAYLVAPADLIPDWVPLLGQADDIVVLGFALHRLLTRAGPELIIEHWDGDDGALDSLLELLDNAESAFLGVRRG